MSGCNDVVDGVEEDTELRRERDDERGSNSSERGVVGGIRSDRELPDDDDEALLRLLRALAVPSLILVSELSTRQDGVDAAVVPSISITSNGDGPMSRWTRSLKSGDAALDHP